jgi:hypothetical protein
MMEFSCFAVYPTVPTKNTLFWGINYLSPERRKRKQADLHVDGRLWWIKVVPKKFSFYIGLPVGNATAVCTDLN